MLKLFHCLKAQTRECYSGNRPRCAEYARTAFNCKNCCCCWLLVVGCWLLVVVVGCWLLVVGCWLLVVGVVVVVVVGC